MSREDTRRNYSLIGGDVCAEFQPADWYRTPISRKRLKHLMERSDRAGLLNYGLWLALLAGSGTWLVLAWGGWWAVPAALVYGVFYGSCAASRWHESAHGTVFKNRVIGEGFYHLASFMALKNPYLWRWSHIRHHTHTIVVGRDPEIAFPRPPSLAGLAANMVHLKAGLPDARRMIRLAFGRLSAEEQDYLVEADRRKAYWTARAHLAVFGVVTAVSVATQSWLPAMLVGLPTFYGTWLHHLLAATQHAGLAEDVPDHRLNSRTVLLNPFLRFVYSNMNYHVEHNMFPKVPFHALADLHAEIRADCPPPYRGVLAAYREMLPALARQRRDPEYFVRRPLSGAATPAH